MFKEYMVLLLLAHVLGDYYIQTEKMAKTKEKSMKWVLLHSLSYWVVMLLVTLPTMSWIVVIGVTIAATLHCFIDLVKFIYISYKNKSNMMTLIMERNIFFIDQLLHSVILIGIAYWFVCGKVQMNTADIVKNFFYVVNISEIQMLIWLLAVLIVHKPANIAISKLLMIYKPESREVGENNESKAGRFIGTVERIIMLILLYIGQYSAIGLVLTAKSIARYDRISKERDFAEYYLLGTLISTVIAIVVSFIF